MKKYLGSKRSFEKDADFPIETKEYFIMNCISFPRLFYPLIFDNKTNFKISFEENCRHFNKLLSRIDNDIHYYQSI